MSRPESVESTVDIAEIGKHFPAPPRLSVSIRKTLPPLPPVLESPRAGTVLNGFPSPPRSPAKPLLKSQEGPRKESPALLMSSFNAACPPPPLSKDPPRPFTASTNAVSFSASFSSAESRRTIKYGTGKLSAVELSPQPSDDPEDPLNWPLWRKHLNFAALLFMVSLIGVMKTVFVSTNSVVAISYSVSYTAAVALTAVPLMISAFTGILSLVVGRIWGKRPVYLVSTLFIFIGVVMNMHVLSSFSQNMAARAFQGLGWGAFETLVLSSIQDTYFRQSKIAIFHAVATATTWGSPLLGGVVSLGPDGFTRQFKIIGGFLPFSILLLAFGAPETMFDRPSVESQTPTATRPRAMWSQVRLTKDAAMEYLIKMKPWSYRADSINSRLILQAPRAFMAPTTALLFAATLLPYASLWSLASSLSLFFSPIPFMLRESAVGALMTGPFLAATAVAATLSISSFPRRFTTTFHVITVVVGTGVASIGILGFGLYVRGAVQMPTDGSASSTGSPWDARFLSDRVSFPVVSFLLAFLGAGSLVLDATIRPVIQRSTAFTSSSLLVALRNTADMQGDLACLRNLAAGIVILGLPNAVWTWDGLKSAAVGIGVVQIVVAGAVCAVWWYYDENVRRLDGRLMGLVDLSILQPQGSFFDTD
ncbi:hypothetical protein DL764_001168 [Monosporascus ibericus]|uniref:Major facilitator superfamily (MFS) profile domain-containing protein n=1 Tax=Monosporascus ibericus TaxID=155417 RepID=A0A4Q4TQM7_9PEZI|nr:hypothetical protein DL764_001168 [Monosporascus ibericus]